MQALKRGVLLFCMAVSCSPPVSAQGQEQTKKLARDIFKQLIEINTTDSVGNVTTAAEVTLPTESVVLISMSCLKISRANFFVCSCPCAETGGEQLTAIQNNRTPRFKACMCSPQNEFHEKGSGPAGEAGCTVSA